MHSNIRFTCGRLWGSELHLCPGCHQARCRTEAELAHWSTRASQARQILRLSLWKANRRRPLGRACCMAFRQSDLHCWESANRCQSHPSWRRLVPIAHALCESPRVLRQRANQRQHSPRTTESGRSSHFRILRPVGVRFGIDCLQPRNLANLATAKSLGMSETCRRSGRGQALPYMGVAC
jgi:hypothetical protein